MLNKLEGLRKAVEEKQFRTAEDEDKIIFYQSAIYAYEVSEYITPPHHLNSTTKRY